MQDSEGLSAAKEVRRWRVIKKVPTTRPLREEGSQSSVLRLRHSCHSATATYVIAGHLVLSMSWWRNVRSPLHAQRRLLLASPRLA